MSVGSCLIGSMDERAPSLEYLEGLEDGMVWARAGILRLLGGLELEEKSLDRADRELRFLVDLVQRKKVTVLEGLLESE